MVARWDFILIQNIKVSEGFSVPYLHHWHDNIFVYLASFRFLHDRFESLFHAGHGVDFKCSRPVGRFPFITGHLVIYHVSQRVWGGGGVSPLSAHVTKRIERIKASALFSYYTKFFSIMAESATRHWFSDAATFDEILLNHKVGGIYLTFLEYLDVVAVLNRQVCTKQLPCRVMSTLSFFMDREAALNQAEHIVSRCSFNYMAKDMEEMKSRFEARGPPHYEKLHPSVHFLKMIVENAEIRPASFIAKHCFTLEWCDKHECCRKIHKWGKDRKLRLVCCDQTTCTSPFGFAVSKKAKPDIELTLTDRSV